MHGRSELTECIILTYERIHYKTKIQIGHFIKVLLLFAWYLDQLDRFIIPDLVITKVCSK